MRGGGVQLLLVPVLLGLGAHPAAADEMLTVSGERIPGIVLDEGPTGVWFEAAPRVAIFFEYDSVIRAERWESERNATLFDRSAYVPPPRNILNAEVVLDTPEGKWVRVKPRFAKFVDTATWERALERQLASSEPETSTEADSADTPAARASRRLRTLRALYDSPEPLTPAQLSHRAGRPDKVTREGDAPLWIYNLGADGTAFVYFYEGAVDYVDIAAPARAGTDQTAEPDEPPEPEEPPATE